MQLFPKGRHIRYGKHLVLKTATTSNGFNNCTFIERDEEKLSVFLQIVKLVLRTHIQRIDKSCRRFYLKRLALI